jgi:predicted dehydrogenase
MTASSVLNLAVVGYGYWGPNIVRNLMERPELQLWGLCELNPERVRKFASRYPGVRTCASFEEVLEDPGVDAVSIATPPSTHYSLVKRALEAGKHVLVEKPLATDIEKAESLVELAERSGLVLMPGHTFLYSPAVNKVRQLIESGELGEIYFVTSSRMNLGIYQPDGVVNDLAPHDLSILLYWLDQPVSIVAASGSTVFPERRTRDGISDAELREGADRKRTGLMARPQEGAADDCGRKQAHGPVRRRGDRWRHSNLRPRS